MSRSGCGVRDHDLHTATLTASQAQAEDAAVQWIDADSITVLEGLDAGRLRAAWPDPDAPDGWRVDASVKAAILSLFADRRTQDWDLGGVLRHNRVQDPASRIQ